MSVVSYELRQVTSIQTGPLYRVRNEVLSAVNSSTAIFVYKTDTQKYDHYATVADLEEWPDSYEQAVLDGLGFYRQTSVQRDWETITEMNADLSGTLGRVQALATELSKVQGDVVIDRTTTISAGS